MIMPLPVFKDPNKNLMLLQTNWAQQLNPIIQSPINGNVILKSIALKTGLNVINHLLGRDLQGWIPVRRRAEAQIWDTQDSNPNPQLTLYLNSSADATVDLVVF